MELYPYVWILWLVFSVLIGYGASARGRNGLTWFLIALVLSPPIALIALLAVPDKRREAAPKATSDDAHPEPGLGVPDEMPKHELAASATPPPPQSRDPG